MNLTLLYEYVTFVSSVRAHNHTHCFRKSAKFVYFVVIGIKCLKHCSIRYNSEMVYVELF